MLLKSLKYVLKGVVEGIKRNPDGRDNTEGDIRLPENQQGLAWFLKADKGLKKENTWIKFDIVGARTF